MVVRKGLQQVGIWSWRSWSKFSEILDEAHAKWQTFERFGLQHSPNTQNASPSYALKDSKSAELNSEPKKTRWGNVHCTTIRQPTKWPGMVSGQVKQQFGQKDGQKSSNRKCDGLGSRFSEWTNFAAFPWPWSEDERTDLPRKSFKRCSGALGTYAVQVGAIHLSTRFRAITSCQDRARMAIRQHSEADFTTAMVSIFTRSHWEGHLTRQGWGYKIRKRRFAKRVLKREWSRIPQNYIRSACNSFKTRIVKIITAKGGHIEH